MLLFSYIKIYIAVKVHSDISMHEILKTFVIGQCLFLICILLLGVQLFQLTFSDQSIKLQDKTARLCGIFYEYKVNSSKSALPRPLLKIFDGDPFG